MRDRHPSGLSRIFDDRAPLDGGGYHCRFDAWLSDDLPGGEHRYPDPARCFWNRDSKELSVDFAPWAAAACL
jgi:hypothetical protein